MSDREHFLELVASVGQALVTPVDLLSALRDVSDRAARLAGMDAAALLLSDGDDDVRHHPGDEGDPVRAIERLQIELREGPCLDTLRTGEAVQVADLRTDRRYPRFAQQALGLGTVSVYSAPMRFEGQVVGALDLLADRPQTLDAEQQAMCRSIADLLTALLVTGEEREHSALLTRQLQEALDSRVVIEQAKGYLAARTGLRPGEAFELLRAFSRRHQRRLREVAQVVVSGELPPQLLRR